ncbi:MAG: hypothetical protein ACNA8P_10180 [Phycisphaerales bacterium]
MLQTMSPLRTTNLARLLVIIELGASVILSGCTRRVGGFRDRLDEARYERDQFEVELRRMTAERDELRAKLSELTANLAAVDGVPAAVVIDSLPRCAGIRIDRLSGLVNRDEQPGFDGIDVNIVPYDARGRFVQVAGTLQVSVVLYPTPGEEVVPRTLVSRTVPPTEIREAYRSTLLSTHYAVRLDLDPPIEEVDGTLILVVQFRDVITGLTHSADRRLRL